MLRRPPLVHYELFACFLLRDSEMRIRFITVHAASCNVVRTDSVSRWWAMAKLDSECGCCGKPITIPDLLCDHCVQALLAAPKVPCSLCQSPHFELRDGFHYNKAGGYAGRCAHSLVSFTRVQVRKIESEDASAQSSSAATIQTHVRRKGSPTL